ncbi:hypothetical protein, partial [Pseudomonas sp.]|uniref:hypothetical protein n=1 Tax=Pseudomonas sp. TaxID=306 RepID=UPI003A9732A8
MDHASPIHLSKPADEKSVIRPTTILSLRLQHHEGFTAFTRVGWITLHRSTFSRLADEKSVIRPTTILSLRLQHHEGFTA